MNKEKLLELSDTLRGIAEGTHVASFEQWHEDGWINCKLKYKHEPQPSPQDPYAELKAAHAAGKTIQYKWDSDKQWFDCVDPKWSTYHDISYRIKPEPRKVPLGPDDVMPCSVFRVKRSGDRHTHIINFELVTNDAVVMRGYTIRWAILAEDYEINRSIPLTGKWDKDAWEPCYKLIEE